MNIDLMNKLADLLDQTPPDQPVQAGCSFNMEVFYSPAKECRTFACIAGHAIVMERGLEELRRIDDDYETNEVAADILGLHITEAKKLFYPWPINYYWEDITPQEGAAAIRRMIRGEEPWG